MGTNAKANSLILALFKKNSITGNLILVPEGQTSSFTWVADSSNFVS